MGTMMNALSAQMVVNTSRVLSNQMCKLMTIQAELYSSTEPTYNFNIGNKLGTDTSTSRIVSMDIVQNFKDNYRDVIDLTFDVTPYEYIELFEKSQGLMCSLIIRHIDKDSGVEHDEPIISLICKVIIKNKFDLLKRFARGDLMPTNRVGDTPEAHSQYFPITVELIDPVVYTARKKQVNFINRNVTINDTLFLLAKTFSAREVYIVPPDNTRKYANLILPPMMSLEDVFTFLQNGKGKGIYNKGMSYYFCNGILYIYPCYDTEPRSPNSTHIYNVGNGRLTGLDSYHSYFNDELHFITNAKTNDEELIERGLENAGSAQFVQHGDLVVDNWLQQADSGLINIASSNISTIALNTSKGMSKDVFTPKFKFSYGNIYSRTSELSYYNRIKVTGVEWSHAIPFSIKPGWRVIYHYDGNEVYQTRSGMCEAVVYCIAKSNRINKQMYSCRATMHLSLSIDQ